MVKRIIALLLCLSLLPVTIINASAEDMHLSDAAKEAYDVLSALEYINNDYTEDMIADIGDFTRAEFAEMAFKVFGNGRKSSAIYYHDVPATHFAAEAIATLVEMKILSVGENKMFYPDNPITRTEAAKILLYALGYDKMCDVRGGWSTGIETMASDIKLYKNVSSGKEITYADMLIMFYNALTSEILEMKGIEGGYPIYESNGGTYLSVYHDIYLGRGILTGANGVSIYGDRVSLDRAYIDDIELELDGKNVDEYLGREVQFLYSYNDENNKLIWIKARRDDEVLILNRYENQPQFSNSGESLSYYNENDKRKTVNISKNLNLIFNGSYVTTGISDILNSNFYEVKLIRSDRKGSAYDVAIISDFENYHIVSLPDENTIYLECCDTNVPNRNIVIDSYEKIEIVTPEGVSLKPAEIPFNNIISVFESKDKEVIKLVVSSNSVSGKVDLVSYENDYYTYIINDVDYSPYKINMEMNCKSGEETTFFLDMNGRIAMLDEGKKSNNFAYLIDVYYSDEGLTEELYIKMFTKSGGVKKYIAKDRIKIDGIRYKDMDIAFGILGGNDVRPQVIAYELNSEGNITMIDLPTTADDSTKKTKDNMLIKNEDASNLYDNLSMRLGQKTIMNSNTVVFGVPGNVQIAEDDEYAQASVSNLEFERTYEYTSYSYTLEDEFFYSDVLAIKANLGVAYWVSTRFAVSDIKVSLNEDDELIYVAEGYHGSEKKEIKLRTTCNPNPETLHEGDVIAVGSRMRDEIISYTTVYCPHTEPHTHITSNTGYSTGGAFDFAGYLYDIKDRIVKISYDDPSVWGQMVSLQNSKILLYDTNDRRGGFREVTPAELITYKTAGNDCDKVYVYINSSQMRNFIVFR